MLITQGSVVRVHAGPLRKAEEGIDDFRLTIDDCLVERVGRTTCESQAKQVETENSEPRNLNGEADRSAKAIRKKANSQRRKSEEVKA